MKVNKKVIVALFASNEALNLRRIVSAVTMVDIDQGVVNEVKIDVGVGNIHTSILVLAKPSPNPRLFY